MRIILLITSLILSLYVQSQNNNESILPNALRVKFSQNIGLPTSTNSFYASQGDLSIGNQAVDQLNSKYRASKMERVFPYAGKFETKHQRYGLHLWYDIYVEPGTSIEELTSQYSNLSEISIAESIKVYKHEDFKGEELNANDPQLQDQWHYENKGQTGGTEGADISLLDAWGVETGDSRVVVSVHDSGIDIDHPDLNDHLWINEGETPNDNIDNDNNGYVDDYYGYNFAAAVVGGDPSDVNDYGGHGTHTSGTIAAESDNGIGVAGIAGGSGRGDGVRIMMMRLGDDNGSPYIYNPAPSFIYAADMGAVISSNSWGGGSYDQSIVDAINYFTAEAGSDALKGGLVLFSSGNSDNTSPDYKSDLDHLIMVSASNHNDQKAWYSNYGTWVDITAPGGETSVQSQGVLSTLPNNSYGFYQGTSMACPHVTGVAALLASKAYGTRLTNTQLGEALLTTTDPIDDANPSYVGMLGSGRLNALAALQAVDKGGSSNGELLIDPVAIQTEINEGESETVTIKVVNTFDFDLEVEIEVSEDFIDSDAVNFSLAPNSVFKFSVEINASYGGNLEQGEIRFNYLSFNSNTTTVLPIEVYTLGDAQISTLDTLDFGLQYVGLASEQLLEISNTGSNYLSITEITNSNSDYSFNFSETNLPPSSSFQLPVSFTPSQGGVIIDSLQIISNDPLSPTYKMILSGNGNTLSPPEVSINPESIFIEQVSATNGSSSFQIANVGEENLEYILSANEPGIVPLEEYSAANNLTKESNPVQDNGSGSGLGDLISHQENLINSESGMAHDGTHLWIKEANGSKIFQYNTVNQQIVDSIASIAVSSKGLDYYNGFLWENDMNNQIIQYDLEGNIINQLELPDQYFRAGIAVDHEGIWLLSSNGFVVLNFDGEISNQYPNYSLSGVESFDIVGSKIYTLRNGRLQVISKGSRYTDYSSSYIGGHYSISTEGLTFDGSNAWVSYSDYDVLVEFKLFRNFLSYYYPRNGVLEPGETQSINFNYYFNDHLEGFEYLDLFSIKSNSRVAPEVHLPVTINITGSPQINTSKNALSFDAYIGYESVDTLTITNDGGAPLIITDISSSISDFSFEFSETVLENNESLDLPIAVTMAATDTLSAVLQITSNDQYRGTLNVNLAAIGRLAPEISASPSILSIELFEHHIDSLPLTISNSGEGELQYYIENEPSESLSGNVISTSEKFSGGAILSSKSEQTKSSNDFIFSSAPVQNTLNNFIKFAELEEVQANLSANVNGLTSLLPSLYSFRDGESGTSISDGGGDMYDGGNRLSTNLGSYISYTNSVIIENDNNFGGGSYFTSKHDGLFTLTANMVGVTSFDINGDLGADGSGYADGSVLSVVHQGVEWLGFVKRVYNAGDPSVNHLIIVPNNGTVTHSFNTYTNSDYHLVDNLTDISRLHYLLFAGQNGLYYDDNSILSLMESYLTLTETTSFENSVDPNSSNEIQIVFDSKDLSSGAYEYDVRIISNDPVSPIVNIPTSLVINPRPIYSQQLNSILYDTAFIGETSSINILITNAGSENLILSDFVLNGDPEIFLEENQLDSLPPGSSGHVTILHKPTSLGDVSGNLSFHTNDPLNEDISIQLNGHGLPSSIISVAPFYTSDTLSIGDTQDYNVVVTNEGTEPLDYRIVVTETTPTTSLVEDINTIQKNSGILEGPIEYPSFKNADLTITESQVLKDANQIADYRVSSGGKNILLLGADNWYNLTEILNELDETGEFGFIGYVNTRYSNLSSINLAFYEAILVWDNSGHISPIALGNSLADYVDQGGGVVTAMFENTTNSIGGRWKSESSKYTLFNSQDFGVQHGYDYAFIAPAENDNHPLLENVDRLEAGYYGLRSTASEEQVSSNAEIVASWNDGTPAIITSTADEIRRVDLGFYPGSNNVMYQSWDPSSDGTQLIVNALNYVAGGIAGSEASWIEASQYQVENQAGGEANEIAFSVNTDGLNEGNVAARAAFYSNDSRLVTRYSYFDISVDGNSQLELADSLNFESVTVGFDKKMSFPIRNKGNGSAQIVVNIDTLSSFRLLSPIDTMNLNAFSQVDVEINLEALSTGNYSDKLVVQNLSDDVTYEVMLTAEVVSPGSIRIEPSEIDLTVEYQGTVSASFTIHNDGVGQLDFLMPAYRAEQVSQNNLSNNTQPIEFSEIPVKGDNDNRTGHPVLLGSGSDSFGYTYVDSSEPESPNYTWNDISATGIPVELNDDDSESIEIDFEFPFYNSRKSSLYIGSNGILSFMEDGSTNPINRQIPSGNSPNSFISPFWKDLSPNNGGSIHYESSTEKCVIQFTEIPDYSEAGTYTFQVIIYPSGDIAFLYESMNGLVNNASIGIENDAGSNGLQVAFNTSYITDKLGVYFTYPQPHISPEITKGSISSGDSLMIPFTYKPLDKIGGLHRHDLAIISNDTLNTSSMIGINAEVIANSLISLYKDTLIFDTTFINRVSSELFWFYNDGLGVLEIDDVNSNNQNINVLFPQYQAHATDTSTYNVNISFNSWTKRLEGFAYGLNGDLLSAKIYSKEDNIKKLISNISVTQSTDGQYEIDQIIPFRIEDQWMLSKNKVYIEFFTSENPSGSGEITLIAKKHALPPNTYSHAFSALYRPNSISSDTAIFSVVSNAENNDEILLTAFASSKASLASIDVSIDSVEEVLTASDSIARSFTISNTGSDSLFVNLSIGNYGFQSNLNPIGFSKLSNEPISVQKRERQNTWIAPKEVRSSQNDRTRVASTDLELRSFYGTVSQFSIQNFSHVNTENNNEVVPLIDVSNYSFSMASEFLPGSTTEILNLSASGQLYITDIDSRTHQYIGDIIGDNDWSGLTSSEDPNVLYASTINSLYKLDLRTLSVSLIGSYNLNLMIGIATDGDGFLYGYDLVTDELFSINKTNGLATSIGSIGFNANFGQDLAYDKQTDQIIMAAYSSANGSELRLVDTSNGSTSLIGEVGSNLSNTQLASIAFQNDISSFVDLEANNYSIAPGQTIESSVKLTALGLDNGEHTADIRISSNDFSNPNLVVPVTLDVVGNNPIVGDYTQSINFGLQTVKSITSETVKVQNIGKEVLEMVLEESSSPYLSNYNIGDTVRIDIGRTFDFDISFNPESIGVFNQFMIWSTNDPDSPEVSIKLSGASERDSRHIALSFTEFSTELYRNNFEDVSLQIDNVGEDSVLVFISDLIETEWLSMDYIDSFIAPNNSIDIPITISSDGLGLGVFESKILLKSNDPLYDSLVIPLKLSVINHEIELINTIEDMLIALDEDSVKLDVDAYFNDNDNDSLIYDISTNGLVVASHDGSTLTMVASSYGLDTVSVSVTDQFGSTLNTTFEIMVNGRPTSTEITDVSRRIDDSLREIVDLNEHFSDPDGNKLSFEIESSVTIAELHVDANNKVIMKAIAEGSADITVTAFDGFHTQSESFNLLIEPPSKHLEIGFLEFNTQLFRENSLDISLQISSIGEDEIDISISKIGDESWLEIDSTSVSLTSESSINIPISISSHELSIGSFESQLLLVSEDPAYDSLTIPIMLDVVNQEIELVAMIPDQLIAINEDDIQLTLAEYFNDNDGDSLIYDVSSNGSISVSHDGRFLTLTANSYGLDTISVGVTDQSGSTLNTAFEVMVNNRPTSTEIIDISRRMGNSISEIVDLNEHFSDSDGNKLSFEIESSATIAELHVDANNKIIMEALAEGAANITVTAFDGFHTQSESFSLLIEPPSKHLEIGFLEFSAQLFRENSLDISLQISSIGEDEIDFSISKIGDESWLEMESTSVSLTSESSINIPISISSHELSVGSFETQLLLVSEDPAYESLTIPIMLDVINQEIELVTMIPDQLIAINEDDIQLTLSEYFSDNDGDLLTYDISSNGSVSGSHDGEVLTLTANSYGLDTISVGVTDQFGGTLNTTFEVMVNNRPNSSKIDNINKRLDEPLMEIIDLNSHFTDVDENELYFEIEALNPIADLLVGNENKVILKPIDQGTTTITITAFDGFHSKTETFELTIGEPLSVNEAINDSFKMFPIPTSDKLEISFASDQKDTYTLRILDLTGKVIHEKLERNISGLIESKFEVSDIPSGYYIMQITVDKTSVLRRKFIKN